MLFSLTWERSDLFIVNLKQLQFNLTLSSILAAVLDKRKYFFQNPRSQTSLLVTPISHHCKSFTSPRRSIGKNAHILSIHYTEHKRIQFIENIFLLGLVRKYMLKTKVVLRDLIFAFNLINWNSKGQFFLRFGFQSWFFSFGQRFNSYVNSDISFFTLNQIVVNSSLIDQVFYLFHLLFDDCLILFNLKFHLFTFLTFGWVLLIYLLIFILKLVQSLLKICYFII